MYCVLCFYSYQGRLGEILNCYQKNGGIRARLPLFFTSKHTLFNGCFQYCTVLFYALPHHYILIFLAASQKHLAIFYYNALFLIVIEKKVKNQGGGYGHGLRLFDLQSNMVHCQTYQTYNFDFDTNPKKIVNQQHVSQF